MQPKTVVIHSGGLDSTVLLYQVLYDFGHEVPATISVNYGQRHKRELESAARIAHDLGIRHEIADLSAIRRLFGASSQTDPDVAVPEGHYESESMKITVVPNRNMILMAVAAAFAISVGAQNVAYGAHAGDHAIYPDCRTEFADAMGRALSLAHEPGINLLHPFTGISKAEIVKLGAELKVPFDRTWSCYQGGDAHCGKCGTCVERREAFELAGVPDPTAYIALD